MGGIKEFFGFGDNKGIDCEDDGQGNKVCRVMVRNKNLKLSTGSEFSFNMDNSCKAHPVGRYSVFQEDEDVVRKAMKQAEAECRGGGSIN